MPPLSDRFPGITPKTILYIFPVTDSADEYTFLDEKYNAERVKKVPIYYEEIAAGMFRRGLELSWDAPPKSITTGFRIGCDPSCEIYIPADREGIPTLPVSRVHCRIHFNPVSGLLLLTDCSKSKTEITKGGKPIKTLTADAPTTVLESKWTIKIAGTYRLTVTIPWDASNYKPYIRELCQRVPTVQNPPQPAPTQNPALKLQQQLEDQKYMDWKFLGSGGFGQVSLLAERSTGALVVGKRSVYGRVARQEIDILKELRHPAIIRYIDQIYPEPGFSMLIMEYSPYGDLTKQNLRKWNEADKFESFHQLLSGLEYLHNRQIMHRDIKPQNILVISRNPVRLKYIDFGLSKKFAEPMSDDLGTLGYRAPEYYSKNGGVSFSSEVWALGLAFLFFYFSETQIFKEEQASYFGSSAWYKRVYRRAQKVDSERARVILINMTKLSQTERWKIKVALKFIQKQALDMSIGPLTRGRKRQFNLVDPNGTTDKEQPPAIKRR
ncbi:hypothetical protein TWF192_005729 [Orbilia oligospora]|nr:hypothetical protein TWF192_005729 [Orbilia oligospora]